MAMAGDWTPKTYTEEELDKKDDELQDLLRERYGRFIRAMKRLGCEHHRSPRMKSITEDEVLEEIVRLVDEEGSSDKEFWNNVTVAAKIRGFREGGYPRYGMPVEFEDKVKAAVDVLGGGNPFDERVTPEAVFDLLGDDLKASLPLHAVWFHLGIVREILRHHKPPSWSLKRHRLGSGAYYHLTPTHAPPDGSGKPPRKLLPFERIGMINEVRKMYEQSSPQPEVDEEESDDEDESQFVKELREQKEMEEKEKADRYRTFLTALRRLAGEDDKLTNITAKDLHKLIIEELVTDDANGYWTVCRVNGLLRQYQRGKYPIWTADHHNKMLEAIDMLGGDPLNEEQVNPRAVLELMNDDGFVVTNIHGVRENLKKLCNALKEDPNHPLRNPKKPRKLIHLNLDLDGNPHLVASVLSRYGARS